MENKIPLNKKRQKLQRLRFPPPSLIVDCQLSKEKWMDQQWKSEIQMIPQKGMFRRSSEMNGGEKFSNQNYVAAWLKPQISNRGRYSISNINQQLTICQQMLKIWCIHLFLFFFNAVKKFVAFIVYSLSFNLADLNWPKYCICLVSKWWHQYSIRNFAIPFSIALTSK